MATWNPGCSSREEDVGRAQRMQAEEAASGHEREREEQDACVAAPVGGLPRRVAEGERDRADESEDDEVQSVVLEMGVEVRPEEERAEPDQRERGQDDRGQDGGRQTPAARCGLGVRGRHSGVGVGWVHRPYRADRAGFRRGAGREET